MRALLALPLLGLAACSQLRPALPSNYAQVNTWAAAHDEVTLRLHERPAVQARSLTVGPDTTEFFDVRRGQVVRVPTAALASVEIRNRTRGGLIGLGLGAAGASTFVLADQINPSTSGTSSRSGSLAVGVLASLAVGVGVGAQLGVAEGYTFRR